MQHAWCASPVQLRPLLRESVRARVRVTSCACGACARPGHGGRRWPRAPAPGHYGLACRSPALARPLQNGHDARETHTQLYIREIYRAHRDRPHTRPAVLHTTALELVCSSDVSRPWWHVSFVDSCCCAQRVGQCHSLSTYELRPSCTTSRYATRLERSRALVERSALSLDNAQRTTGLRHAAAACGLGHGARAGRGGRGVSRTCARRAR